MTTTTLHLPAVHDELTRLLEAAVEPALRAGALVVADDTSLFPEALAPYLARVRDPRAGYLSVDLPIGDRLELSARGEAAP